MVSRILDQVLKAGVPLSAFMRRTSYVVTYKDGLSPVGRWVFKKDPKALYDLFVKEGQFSGLKIEELEGFRQFGLNAEILNKHRTRLVYFREITPAGRYLLKDEPQAIEQFLSDNPFERRYLSDESKALMAQAVKDFKAREKVESRAVPVAPGLSSVSVARGARIDVECVERVLMKASGR
jgi:hypothetical protein